MPRKELKTPKKSSKFDPPLPYRLPTLAEGAILATAASKGFFEGWRSRTALYEKAAIILGVRKVHPHRGAWQERRWSAPLRRVAAKADGAGALCGIWVED
jgi:hypothetical protein